MTYLFTMRPGAIFQDGAPVDANAVQLNMERIRDVKDLAGGTRNRGGIQYADFFEATDDATWKLVNGEPFGPTLAFFQQFPGTGLLISPEHFDTAVTNPVGAGHLKHVVHEPGERWVGERWDGYWDNDNVHLDGFVQNIIPDQNTAWNAFLNGDIDIDAPTGGVNSDLQADLEADGMKVIRGTAQTWTQTWFNLNPNAPSDGLPFNAFRDPRLRHAYNRALDRQAINEVAWEGLGAPSRAPVSVESWALPKDKNYYPEHDLQVAHELMDAAGYGDGIEGIHLSYIAEFQTVVTEPVNSQMRNAGMEMEYIKGNRGRDHPASPGHPGLDNRDAVLGVAVRSRPRSCVPPLKVCRTGCTDRPRAARAPAEPARRTIPTTRCWPTSTRPSSWSGMPRSRPARMTACHSTPRSGRPKRNTCGSPISPNGRPTGWPNRMSRTSRLSPSSASPRE